MRGLVAIVTGAAGSLGRATVEKFLADGMKVVAFDRQPFDRDNAFNTDIYKHKHVTHAMKDFYRIRLGSKSHERILKEYEDMKAAPIDFDDLLSSPGWNKTKQKTFSDGGGRNKFFEDSPVQENAKVNIHPQSMLRDNEEQNNAEQSEESDELYFKGQDHMNCIEWNGDVTSTSDVNDAIEQAIEDWGSLNVVVNCAAVASSVLVYNKVRNHAVNYELIKDVINNNTKGTFNVNRLAAKVMANNDPDTPFGRGVIINTSSSIISDKGSATYTTSCGGIEGLTLPMSRDLAGLGIRVVTIAPGIIASALVSKHPPPEVVHFLGQLNVFPKRVGKPEEYAHLVTAVISNQMLNGVTIKLDAGLRYPFDI